MIEGLTRRITASENAHAGICAGGPPVNGGPYRDPERGPRRACDDAVVAAGLSAFHKDLGGVADRGADRS